MSLVDRLIPERRTLSRNGLQLQDDWLEFSLWGGNKLTLYVSQPYQLQAQLASAQPPYPPLWSEDPLAIPPGPYGHAGDFGYFRLRNATPGQIAVVTFNAYAGE